MPQAYSAASVGGTIWIEILEQLCSPHFLQYRKWRCCICSDGRAGSESATKPQDIIDDAGAKRGLLNLPLDETVGLVGLHWGERFFEFVPQNGRIKWEVEPWGSWKVNPLS
jgi:hypothetical protein